MAKGDYTKTTYANGTAPALNQTNLNNNEDKLNELDKIQTAQIPTGSFTDITTNIGATSTFNLDIATGIDSLSGGNVLIRTNAATKNRAVTLYFGRTSGQNYSMEVESTVGRGYIGALDGFLSASMFDTTNAYIRVNDVYLLSSSYNTIRVVFYNTDSSTRQLWIRGCYQVFL